MTPGHLSLRREIGLTRRDFLRFGLAAFALSWPTGACQKGSRLRSSTPKKPGEPEPVYELSDGNALYDDFDGNGNYQAYDNQNLAAAGELSSKLWLAYAGSEVILEPAADALFACVNENGERIEHALLERPVSEISAYLAENQIPLTALDREVLKGFLTEQGQAAVADIEIRPLDEQVKVIQYILSKQQEILNVRGRRLAKTLSEVDPSISLREGTAMLARQVFNEKEQFVLNRFLAEKRVYESFRSSVLRMPAREAPQETEYVFDAKGRLMDADPHLPGQPYRASRKLLVVAARDDFLKNGGELVPIKKGTVYGSAQIVPSPRSGYVLQITNKLKGTRCLLNNPPELDFADYKSFSADVMLSSASAPLYFSAGFDYHTTIPEQPPGKSWYAHVVILKNTAGNVLIMGAYGNVNLGIFTGDLLASAQLDRWYNLRLDIVTNKQDDRLQADEIRLDYYVDGILRASRIPEDSAILIDPNRTGWGPQRSLIVTSEEGEGDSIGYFNNVRAVYRNRIG